jgi:hypothetical protein
MISVTGAKETAMAILAPRDENATDSFVETCVRYAGMQILVHGGFVGEFALMPILLR